MTSTVQSPIWEELLNIAKIDVDREEEIAVVCARITAMKDLYTRIADAAGCQWWMVGIIHYREDNSLSQEVYLHNGDPLGKPTTNEPKGIFFRKDQFFEASVDAMSSEFHACYGTGLFCTLAERYNGYGYRHHGIYSPYLVAATNLYTVGKYTSDGHFNPDAHDDELGVIALLKGLIPA